MTVYNDPNTLGSWFRGVRGSHLDPGFSSRYATVQRYTSAIPWNIVLLSICSSLDNFTVGVAFGASGGSQAISLLQNVIISAVNALGQFLFMFGGQVMANKLETLGCTRYLGLLPMCLFMYLAGKEFYDAYQLHREDGDVLEVQLLMQPLRSRTNEPVKKEESLKSRRMTWYETASMSLALSFSNMAGGLAGGLAAMSPWCAEGLHKNPSKSSFLNLFDSIFANLGGVR